jgi:hypothetical protein
MWLHIKTFEPTATHRLGQAGRLDDHHHKKWFAEELSKMEAH